MDKSKEMKNQKSSLAKSKFILCKDHQGLLKSFPLSLSLFETEERLVGTEPWPSMFRLVMHHDFAYIYIAAFRLKNYYFRLLLLSYTIVTILLAAPYLHQVQICSLYLVWAMHICNQIGTLRLWVRCNVGYVHLQLWWFSQTAGRPQASCSNVYRPCTKENRGRELDVIKIA